LLTQVVRCEWSAVRTACCASCCKVRVRAADVVSGVLPGRHSHTAIRIATRLAH